MAFEVNQAADLKSLNGCNCFCSWSGGKDSCLALHRALRQGARPRRLLTMLDEDGRKSRSHGLPRELLQSQARSLGIPLLMRPASWNDYEAVFSAALSEMKEQGIEAGVFGDIDIEEHRQWARKVCASAGLRLYHPLWQTPRNVLLKEMIELGFKATIIAVKEGLLDRSFLGRVLDAELCAELEASGIDPCGELGEYHTVVTDGPGFTTPLRLELKGQVLRGGCWFQEVCVLD